MTARAGYITVVNQLSNFGNCENNRRHILTLSLSQMW